MARRAGAAGFLAVWLAFAAFAAGAAALGWVLTALLSFRLLPIGPALFQAVLTAAVYPALAVLFIRAHRWSAESAPDRAAGGSRPQAGRAMPGGPAMRRPDDAG